MAVVVAVLSLAGCDQRQSLVGPGPGGSTVDTSPVLPGDSILREGMILRVGVRSLPPGDSASVSLLLLNAAGGVLWRSAPVATDSAAARVQVVGLPDGMKGKQWVMTALLERNGGRVYAGSDSAGATSLASAASRDVMIFPGRSIPLGGTLRALAPDAHGRRVFFSLVGSGDVGVLDLAEERVGGAVAHDRSEVWDIDVAGNTLAYLADAGSRVSFIDLVSKSAGGRALLGPLVVRLTRSFAAVAAGTTRTDTLLDVVRPYATGLRLACDVTPACERPVAVLSSPTEGGGSLIRLVRADAGAPAVLLVDHTAVPGGADTVPAAALVTGAERPTGEAETVAHRSGVAGCVSLHLGLAGLGVSHSGTLFSAGREGCGPAGRLVRVDAFQGASPTLSRLGVATMLAEDRIRAPVELAASADGERVLVREADAVWLLDRDLRILGFVRVSDRARAAWLNPAPAGPLQFMVADAGALQVFEADTFRMVESLAVGPLAGAPPAFVSLLDGRRVAVIVPAERPESVVLVTFGPR